MALISNSGLNPGFLPSSDSLAPASVFQPVANELAIQLETAVSYFAVCEKASSARALRCSRVVPPVWIAEMTSL